MPAIKLLMVVFLISVSLRATAGETRRAVDPVTGAESWEIHIKGISLKLAQILPDQIRGFYLARGFDVASTERIAAACVFQTIFRNKSAPGAIHINLADWRALTPEGEQPLKLKHTWNMEWEERGVPPGARTAFQWALFPTEQTFQTGDWNMGMTTIALPLGSRFDLRFVWSHKNKHREAVLRGILCATDTIPKTEGQETK